MSFKLSTVNTDERRPGKYISYGIQELKINKIEIRTAASGSKVCNLFMETPPVTDSGFAGANGARGRIGTVQFPRTYIAWDSTVKNPKSNETPRESFIKDMLIIADKFGVREEANALEFEEGFTFEDFVKGMESILVGHYAMWKLCGEQNWYTDQTGTLREGYRLATAKWGFIQNTEDYKSNPKLKFDPTNQYDLKLTPKPEVSSEPVAPQDSDFEAVESKDDLPF